EALRGAFSDAPLSAVLVYATMNHDQEALLQALHETLGPSVAVLGCSTQGIMGKGFVRENGYGVAAIGLGGAALSAKSCIEREIAQNGREKGAKLAEGLTAEL